MQAHGPSMSGPFSAPPGPGSLFPAYLPPPPPFTSILARQHAPMLGPQPVNGKIQHRHARPMPGRGADLINLQYSQQQLHREDAQGPQMLVPKRVSVRVEEPSMYSVHGLPNTMTGQNAMGWPPVPPQMPRIQYQSQQQGNYSPMYMQGVFPQYMQSVFPPSQMYAPYDPQQMYGSFPPQSQQQQRGPIMQHMQPQQQSGGGMVAPPGSVQQMQAPAQLQQQQQMHPQMQQQPGAPQMHAGGPLPQHSMMNMQMMQQQQQQQPQQQLPLQPRKTVPKKVIAIIDPKTNETLNQTELLESLKDGETAKDNNEPKGTEETDAVSVTATPEIKQQVAAQLTMRLEMTNIAKAEQQPASAAPAAPPAAATKKILFDATQLKELKLEGKVAHAPAPPSHAITTAPVLSSAPAAATPAVPVAVSEPAAVKAVETTAAEDTGTEYLPARITDPTFPDNYKEQLVVSHEEDMPPTNDEHQEDAHLVEEAVQNDASSSSEKNTSNDSAICVQTPSPPPQPPVVAPAAPAPVVAAPTSENAADNKNSTPNEKPEDMFPVAETIVTKLENLMIVESGTTSQEEAEGSDPTTPAPVTPSVSETTTTLVEEDEDAERVAAAEEEEKQRKRTELESMITAYENDPEQCDVGLSRYNREYLYAKRDYEKLFAVTECQLTPAMLKELGICRSLASSQPKKKRQDGSDFMPSWHKGGGGGGGMRDRKPYAGRQSEQHNRGGDRGKGTNKKVPPQFRPSIERRVDSNVTLHKAEKAWKVDKAADDLESDDAQKKVLLKNVRALFNKITPTTKDDLIDEFLNMEVYKTPCLADVVSIIFDKAVEEPKFCPLYSTLCASQVKAELRESGERNVSHFRNMILQTAQHTFATKTLDEFVAAKREEIDAEEDEKKKREKQIELLEAQSKFRRRKFGNITFIGQLYLQKLLSFNIIHACVANLLMSVPKKAQNGPTPPPPSEADEESIDCVVRLMETIGKSIQEEVTKQAAGSAANNKAAKGTQQAAKPGNFIDMTYISLEKAQPYVSSRIRFMIMNLLDLRKNNWVQRKIVDQGPKKLDEIRNDIRKEQLENQNAQLAYERKVSRQDGGLMSRGSMGNPGSGNPKRGIIQRNSMDRGTVEERRTQAVKQSNLASRSAPPKKSSLAAVTSERTTLGLGRDRQSSRWSYGATGGSENSKKEDRMAAVASAARMGRSSSTASTKASGAGSAIDEEKVASGATTQANSEDERATSESNQKQEAELLKKMQLAACSYPEEITLDEYRDEIFAIASNENAGKPSLQAIFKSFMNVAFKKVSSGQAAASYGHILAYCLLKKAVEKDNRGREEMLRGVCDFCREAMEQEIWEDRPKAWEYVAEVLLHAHLPTEGLFDGAHPTLVDFRDSFCAVTAPKPYALFVLVLKQVAELHYKRDKDNAMEVCSWVLDECAQITKQMDTEKLEKAMRDTNLALGGGVQSLYAILKRDG